MIFDFEYFVTVVVIPHSDLPESNLTNLITQEAVLVVGVYFVTSKLGIVAVTLANFKETVTIKFEETSSNPFLTEFLSSTVVKRVAFI
jgi:hypothetical protein